MKKIITGAPRPPARRGEVVIPRRTLTTGAAWAVPAVTLAAAAPAYATSTLDPTCTPVGCKGPGATGDKWSYHLRLDCGPASPVAVTIDEIPAIFDGDRWTVCDMGNSRAHRSVVVTFADGIQWARVVFFPPCAKGERAGVCEAGG